MSTLEQTNETVTPAGDGVDHINIYTGGQTKLGRLLSNLAPVSFIHPTHGKFNTVEGFWYWARCGYIEKYWEDFSTASGFDAKRLGKTLPRVEATDFQKQIENVIELKIRQNQELRELLRESTLPLRHYYFYGSGDKVKVIDMSKKYSWQIEHIDSIRNVLKGNTRND